MSSKVGLRKRREGEGEVLGLQHPLWEACVHPVCDGKQGRLRSRKLTRLEPGSSKSTHQAPQPPTPHPTPPRALTMMTRKYTD